MDGNGRNEEMNSSILRVLYFTLCAMLFLACHAAGVLLACFQAAGRQLQQLALFS